MSRTLFTGINMKLERACEFIEWLLIEIVVPIGFIPPIITTIVNYCLLNLDSTSFIVPCPMMYVWDLYI